MRPSASVATSFPSRRIVGRAVRSPADAGVLAGMQACRALALQAERALHLAPEVERRRHRLGADGPLRVGACRDDLELVDDDAHSVPSAPKPRLGLGARAVTSMSWPGASSRGF